MRHHDSQPYSRTAARVYLSLEPLGDVGGAEDLAAHRAKGLRRLFDPSLDVVVVREVVVEERAEVHERLREADGAAAVEHQVRGVAVAVSVRPRWAKHGLCLAPLAVRPDVHEEAEEPKVVVDRVARRQQGRPRGEWGGSIVGVQ